MDLLDRLHARLREALEEREDGPHAPFTIGELYQRLIPYRAVRRDLALLELAPYEHALLRLLAGERGYLEIDSDGVLDDLRRELQQPNPILGVYRDYAEVEVRLTDPSPTADENGRTSFVAPPLFTPPPAASPSPSVASEASVARGGAGTRAGTAARPGVREIDGREDAAAAPSLGAAARCVRCEGGLPAVEGLRFCPSCGADQVEPSCAGCGAAMRGEWSFCVLCGHPQRGGRGEARPRGE